MQVGENLLSLSCAPVSQWHDVNAQSQSGTGKMVTSSSISNLQRNNVKKEESQALLSCTPGCAKPYRTTPDFIMETLSLCFWHVDGTAVIQPGLTRLWESCFLPRRTENLAGLQLLRIGFRHPCPMGAHSRVLITVPCWPEELMSSRCYWSSDLLTTERKSTEIIICVSYFLNWREI